MLLYIRFIWMLITNFTEKKIKVGETTSLDTIVMPTDLDSMRANASSFLKFADLGQWQNLYRAGFFQLSLKKDIHPCVRSSTIWYNKGLKAFSRIKIETELGYWDRKYFYWNNRIYNSKGELAAQSFTKVQVRSKGKHVPSSEALSYFESIDRNKEPSIPKEVIERLETPESFKK